jgi:iron complex transport system ATP-binding protein
VSDVRLTGVSVAYEAVAVVRDLDLSVESGEWLSLIGPNGAGKTSVLRAIAGLVPFTGQIAVGGTPVRELGTRELARKVAVLPQEPHLPEGMTVARFVLLGRIAHIGYFGRERAEDRRIVSDVLDRLALADLADRPLENLSGGERRRAAIARALAQRAPILLIDEPTSSLDVGRQQEVLELVDELRREQALTVVAAMHELTLAGQYGDRVGLLVGGRLVSLGLPAEVLTETTINDHYHAHVSVLPMNGSGRAVVPVRHRDPR